MHSSEMRSTRLQAVPALSLLTGLLFDEAGHRLTPTHALKNGKRYRYYVSAPLTRGEKVRNGIRIPAPDLEELVVKTIRCRLRDPVWLANVFDSIVAPQDMQSLITSAKTLARSLEGGGDPDARQSPKSYLDLIQHITVAKGNVTLALNRLHLAKVLHLMDNESPGGPTSDDFEVEPILIGIRAQFIRAGKQVRLILGEVTTQDRLPDPDLIWLIADAHRWFEDLRTGKAATIGEIAKRDRVPAVHISRTLPLAFLAPDIIEMILTGRQSPSLTSDRLKRRQSLPFLWSEQREVLLS